MARTKAFNPRMERPWDVALTTAARKRAFDNRKNPTGDKVPVAEAERAGKTVNVYPWTKLEEGDFFVAKVRGSENAMLTTFRQAAAKHDMEVAIHPWDDEESQYFRVTCVLKGISRIKARARSMGAHAPSFNWRKAEEYRTKRRSKTEEDASGVSILPSDPSTLPVHVDGVPLDEEGARAALLATRREAIKRHLERAAMEEVGLDPEEDEDYMGIKKSVFRDEKLRRAKTETLKARKMGKLI